VEVLVACDLEVLSPDHTLLTASKLPFLVLKLQNITPPPTRVRALSCYVASCAVLQHIQTINSRQ
jgi:hypothetical protein